MFSLLLSYRLQFEQAIKNHDCEEIRICLSKGATVDMPLPEGEELPLHLATKKGDCEIVRMLIDEEANVNATDENGSTALHIAASYDHKAVIQLLLDCKAEVNAMDHAHWKPLHCAARHSQVDSIELLIKNGTKLLPEGEMFIVPHQFAHFHHREDVSGLLLRAEIQDIKR